MKCSEYPTVSVFVTQYPALHVVSIVFSVRY